MSSSTLKRSVATLGVVAGLLAAVGPAGAKTMAEDSFTDSYVDRAAPQSMLDYQGSVVVTYSRDASRGDAEETRTALRGDKNEVAVEGIALIREPRWQA